MTMEDAMTREDLLEAVIEALRETQRMSGHDVEAAITGATVPIGDLIQFDSHNGIEATVALEERVGHPLPVNLFTDDSTRRPRSVDEVVDRLLNLEAVEKS
jgi:hypothetical protein